MDTSGVLAHLDADQERHDDVTRVIASDSGPFLLSPFVAAEVDYLLLDRVGADAELVFLEEVARGAYHLQAFGMEEVEQARQVIRRYRDFNIGLADASLVVIAARAGTNRLLTLNERHFRAIRPLRGRAFTLLPADAS